jgi:hypothetical protein
LVVEEVASDIGEPVYRGADVEAGGIREADLARKRCNDSQGEYPEF